MQRDLNDIKTLFDDFLVNSHFIMKYHSIHQDPQDKMERASSERMLRCYFPHIQVIQIRDRVG